jgi:hypothetical protein
MSTTFYICHCGFTKDNHNFKHDYKDTALVFRTMDSQNNETFVLDANHFPVRKGVKCGKENCISTKPIHNTEIVRHLFEPFNYDYREINLTLPEDTMCSYKNCKSVLKNHKNVMTHIFETKAEILNKTEYDVLSVIDSEDDDFKIKLV